MQNSSTYRFLRHLELSYNIKRILFFLHRFDRDRAICFFITKVWPGPGGLVLIPWSLDYRHYLPLTASSLVREDSLGLSLAVGTSPQHSGRIQMTG